MKKIALFTLCLLIGGCSGTAPTAPSGPVTTQTFGSLTTRIVGTAQPPVFSSKNFGANVTGIAGALIDQVLLNRYGSPTYRDAKIVFHSDRDGNLEIYSMNADGTGQIRLTSNTAADYQASWSPDSSKIVFVSNRDGGAEIYTMNTNGTNTTRLTNDLLFNESPVFSPDGSKIAFISLRDGNYEIYSMNADGTGQTRLTNNTATDIGPSWSPDSNKITFSSFRDGNHEIYSMNANGTNPIRLTSNASTDQSPSWSPDGSKIAFHSFRDGNYEIYSMYTDGSGQTRLTNSPGWELSPSWSSDSAKIAFHSDREGNYEIYSMNYYGGGETNLTKVPGSDRNPSWSKPLPRPPVKLLGVPSGLTLSTAAGVLIGQRGDQVTSCLAFDTSPTSRTASRISALTSQESDASNLVFSITVSVELLNMAFVNIDENGTPGPFNVPGLINGGTGAVVSFNANTGYVSSVIPYVANRGNGGLKHRQSGDILTVSAAFTGIFDAHGKNSAPNGAGIVRINAKTGEVVGFE